MLSVGREFGYEVWVGDGQPATEPFSVARSMNMLAAQADSHARKPWDIIVRWAADCLLENWSKIGDAVSQIEWHAKAFSQSCNQSEQEWNKGEVSFRATGAMCFGGIELYTRDAWEGVGGYDSRFVGYGAEDYALVHGLELLNGPRDVSPLIPGIMALLWHPHHKRNARAARDPFWQRRGANLALWRKEIEPITNPYDWYQYRNHRYSQGYDNPYWTGDKA